MKRAVSMFLCLSWVLGLVLLSRANVNETPAGAPNPQHTPDNEEPYSPIWVRNVFGLQPAPSSSTNNDAAAPPPANVKLVGIYTIFGKRAIFSVQENGPAPAPATRPGGFGMHPQQQPQQQQKKDQTYVMSEGERRGALEVLEINVKERYVKIKNDDIESTLHFETNAPSGPAPIAGGPHPPPAMPGFQPPPQPGMNYNNGMPGPLPNRTMRSSMNNTSQPNFSPAGFSTGYGQNMQSQSALSPEQSAIAAAAYNLANQQKIQSGQAPPLPMLPGMSDPGEPPPPPSGVPQLPPGLAGRGRGGMANFLPPTPPGR